MKDAPAAHATGEARGDAIEGRQVLGEASHQVDGGIGWLADWRGGPRPIGEEGPCGSSTDALTPAPDIEGEGGDRLGSITSVVVPERGGRETGSFVASGSLTSNSLTEASPVQDDRHEPPTTKQP